MQSMTVLRRIVEGEECHIAGGYRHPELDFSIQITDDTSVRFDIQVAADLFWLQDKARFQRSAVGPVKPPFPDIWMEWEIPEGAFIDTPESGQDEHMLELIGMRQAGYVIESEDRPGEYIMSLFAISPDDGSLFTWPTSVVFTVDERGIFERGWSHRKVGDISELAFRESSAMVDVMATPMFVALGLINCRNVRHAETGAVKMRRSGTEKRCGVPPRELRYNTILLPGSGTVRGASQGGSHRAAAVHRVRGHFKTFTAEKPLLGRHVGTYWWGWQVRGNPEYGEVQSDYVIGERE